MSTVGGVFTSDPLPERPSPDNPSGKLVLLRHGETQWSKSGKHTGLTDVPLTARGEDLARGAGKLVLGYEFSLILTSPLQRARRTAQLAGLDAEVDPLLVEWDYGGYEGRTTHEIRKELGYNWSAFTHGVIRGSTPGETVEQVAARASRVLTRVLPAMAEGDGRFQVASATLLISSLIMSAGLRYPRMRRGRMFRSRCVSASSSWVIVLKFVPFG